jgi:hypothetical protein
MCKKKEPTPKKRVQQEGSWHRRRVLTVTHSVNGFLQIQELEFDNHDDTVKGLAQIFLKVAGNLMAGLQSWKNQL